MLPKRNYAELLALLVGIMLYSLRPNLLDHLAKAGYGSLKILLFLLFFVMLGDILTMCWFNQKN